MIERIKKIYITADGKEFDNAYDAKEHETELEPERHYGEFLMHLSIGFNTEESPSAEILKNKMEEYIHDVIDRVEYNLKNDDVRYPYYIGDARLYKAAFVDNAGNKIEFEK